MNQEPGKVTRHKSQVTKVRTAFSVMPACRQAGVLRKFKSKVKVKRRFFKINQ